MNHQHTLHHAIKTLSLCIVALGSAAPAAAQTSDVPSPVEAARLTATDPALDSEAVRLQTLTELQARDAVLTRRVRGFGVGFGLSSVLVGSGLVAYIRNFDLCILGCVNTRTEQRRYLAGSGILAVGIFGQVASLIGLTISSTQRRRGRRRIAELSLSPVAAVTDTGASTGLSMHLTW